ncbi:putative membrane protein [Thermanaerovibrio velox DSM 12556]|uniref:Putative membrane protein n=1 Tax=Thermanaerovibrio velox DSM 12556 TaxID=926567 RepID=H0UN68_9BACT|nr:trimeric intracellular cation channel family protein [Thermanaerovibrio velox]EHM10353.1 putative membrane protein [Thermanaerovibrio velox DSM 12556]
MILWNLFEALGTAAFAASGALTGVKKGFDLFGVCVLGLVTAVGGGITRDILSGNLPPLALRDPYYCLIAVATSVLVFIRPLPILKMDKLIVLMDAVGLGAFSAGGGMLAINMGFQSAFTVTAMGVITAVGGGILRDVLSGSTPLIFHREVYAVAALAGSATLLPITRALSGEHAMYLCMMITTVSRIYCATKGIHLPSGRPGRRP